MRVSLLGNERFCGTGVWLRREARGLAHEKAESGRPICGHLAWAGREFFDIAERHSGNWEGRQQKFEKRARLSDRWPDDSNFIRVLPGTSGDIRP